MTPLTIKKYKTVRALNRVMKLHIYKTCTCIYSNVSILVLRMLAIISIRNLLHDTKETTEPIKTFTGFTILLLKIVFFHLKVIKLNVGEQNNFILEFIHHYYIFNLTSSNLYFLLICTLTLIN